MMKNMTNKMTNKMTNGRQTNDKQMTTNKNDKNEKNEKEIKENIKKKFQKPTIEEIQQYCLEKGYNIDAQYFIDYYESNGWKIGRNAMKDWKATVRTWNQRNKKVTVLNPKKESNFEQRNYKDLSYLYANKEE